MKVTLTLVVNAARLTDKLQMNDHDVDVSPFVVGRDSGCNLQLSGGTVSRQHFKLEIDGDAIYIEDLGSKTGTSVGGFRISERKELSDRDEIEVGLHLIRISISD